MKRKVRQPCARGAFTLVELLVVILIIIVLIGILIPVVNKIRISARTANTQSTIAQLSNAINTYFGDFKAYPGPLTNIEVWNSDAPFPPNSPFTGGFAIESVPASEGYDTSQDENTFRQQVTGTENMVLGLLGGLKVRATGAPTLVYDPRLVGGGPNSLTTVSTGAKRYKAYMENAPLSWRTGPQGKTGKFKDDAGEADDTIIPEVVDAYNDPLPILYLRARIGAAVAVVEPGAGSPVATEDENRIITYSSSSPSDRKGQYDLHQILGYTEPVPAIGVGRKTIKFYNGSASPINVTPPNRYHGLSLHGHSQGPLPSAKLGPPGAGYYYPYNAYPYFRSKSLSGQFPVASPVPHNKDGFILISAGPDRIYGTEDDITNFGEVGK